MKFVLMKERPLVGFVLFFMMGAYLATVISIPIKIVIALLVLAILAIGISAYFIKKVWYYILIVSALVGYIACLAQVPSWYYDTSAPPEPCSIYGVVDSMKNTDYSSEYILKNVEIDNEKIASKVQVKHITNYSEVEIGDNISLYSELERWSVAQKEGMYSPARYYMTKNIQYTCTLFGKGVDIVEKAKGIASITSRWHDGIYGRLKEDFSQPALGFIFSLVSGDKSYMDKQIYSTSAELGIAHIFAISGLHIGVLLLLWELLCKKLKMRFLIRTLGSLSIIVVLLLVVGNRASLLRATLMWGLIVVYLRSGIKNDLLGLLSIAALLLLIYNPLLVLDVGFIMSISCVLAIAVVYLPLTNKYKNTYLASLFILSASILSMCWIVGAKIFGNIAPLSPIWNVLFVPLAVVIICAIVIYALVWYIPVVGLFVANIIEIVAKLTISLIEIVDKVNISINMPSISLSQAIGIFGVSLLMTDIFIRGRKRTRIVVGCLAIIAIVFSVYYPKEPAKIEVFSGYNDTFIYISADDKSLIIINQDDGGVLWVLNDLNDAHVDTLIYSGNKIEDIESLILSLEGVDVGQIYAHKDLLDDYSGDIDIIGIVPDERILFLDSAIRLERFKANKNAIVNYCAIISYDSNSMIYLDPLKLREGALTSSDVVVCSRWTKQRIENVSYANSEYVIMSSSNYLLDDTPTTTYGQSIRTYNITSEGSIAFLLGGK